jgi:hypothetical protein
MPDQPDQPEEIALTVLEIAALHTCLGYECLRVEKVIHARSRHKFIYNISRSAHYLLMKEYHSEAGLAVLMKPYHEAARTVFRWRANADVAPDGIYNVITEETQCT